MSCHIYTPSDGPLAGSKVILCGNLPKPKRCVFCNARGEFLCDWPVEKPVPVKPHDVRHGDLIVNYTESIGRVIDIRAHADLFDFRLCLTRCPVGRARLVGTEVYTRFHVSQKVRVIRTATCDSPACDLHVREVGDDRHYCVNHWNAWSEVQ